MINAGKLYHLGNEDLLDRCYMAKEGFYLEEALKVLR